MEKTFSKESGDEAARDEDSAAAACEKRSREPLSASCSFSLSLLPCSTLQIEKLRAISSLEIASCRTAQSFAI